MAYDNNDADYESATPKKADVLIKSTQTIVSKQEELSEQTKLAISRIDEAIELCHKNSEEASYILDHSTEMFEKLQAENSALKQELLYLAKQSENIYASLAEKLNGLQVEGAQTTQPLKEEAEPDANYYELADRLEEIYDRLAEMTARIDALSVQKSTDDLNDKLNDKFAILYDKIDAVSFDNARPVQVQGGLSESDGSAILDKLDRIIDTVRKNESAHSMLADKFEILSMRVEQFGFESAKPQPGYNQPAAPAPVQSAEIDYDKLAAKVADILSVRETVSPDYIASKVAEQIVLPEQDGGAEIDTQKIAEEVASLLNTKDDSVPFEIDEDAIADKLAERVSGIVAEAKAEPVNEDAIADKLAERVSEIVTEAKAEPVNEDAIADKLAQRVSEIVTEAKAEPINEEALADAICEKMGTAESAVTSGIDEEALAERIADKLSSVAGNEEIAPVEINEEVLAERIAEKLNVVAESEVAPEALEIDDEALVEKIVSRLSGLITEAAPVNADINIDREDLADAIALKVGSLRPEEFEILVDDAGCASISKEIAEKIDYNVISSIIADKLREVLDLSAVSAPDYEDMAERISEKITVAGINEDAIADKAAAVLSNYLPEFDTEEIADKVTGAVIDVVSAMPQPTLDSEAICNEISERLIEKQEDNNYDIVIDEDGISKITALVSEELEKDTDERFNKLEEGLAKICELLTPEEVEESEEVEELEELEDNTDERFSKLEEGIAKIYELLTTEEEEESDEVEELEEDADSAQFEELDDGEITEEELASLSEVVATEIEKGTASRFDKVEEDIARIYELVSGIVVEEETEEGEYESVEYDDADYTHLSEIVASEIEKGVTARLDSVDEKLSSLTEMLTAEAEEVAEDDEAEEVYAEEADGEEVAEEIAEEEELSEEEYQSLTEMFAQMENNLSSRFDSVEEKITSLTELMTEEEEAEATEEEISEEQTEEIYAEEEQTDDGYAKLSEIVSARFDSVEEKITSLTELIQGADEEEYEDYEEATEEDYTKLSEIVATEIEKGVTARFDSVEENIRKINAIVGGLAVGAVNGGGDRNVEADIRLYEQFDKVTADIRKISQYVEGDVPVITNERLDKISSEIAKISQLVEGELSLETNARLDKLQEEIEKLSSLVSGNVTVTVTEPVKERDDRALIEREQYDRAYLEREHLDRALLERVEGGVHEIKGMLIGGAMNSADETAAAQTAEVEEEEELVTVSDIVKPIAIDEDEEDDGDDGDFLLSALDMDKFSDDEHMPGELGDLEGVDFENMMKYNRSFIARIIQSDDDCKQYYGAVKHALLSYKKVNSNVAWGNERFNKGRETIARMKIRGKTLVVYLALDPNEYKTSVYHHADVSDNKSVLGTPMMIKVKSPLGVRKAIRLIDEMLAKRNGEKRELPERDYAAMYPYETIEELIEDGLVKDVRKK